MTDESKTQAHHERSPALLQAYVDYDRAFRVQQAKVGCILVLICMPLGLALDWFVYPSHVLSFFVFGRLLCDVAVLPLFLLLRGRHAERHVNWIGVVWPALPAVAISWMIFATEGSRSPYYAGLILVLIVACQLMPYTLREAAVVCGVTLLTYLLACVAHAMASGEGVSTAILFNNVYFISITTLICLCSCHFGTRRRMTEFALRQELDQRNRELAELDRLKSEFFANISHELRTPLTLIIAPTDRLLADAGLSDSVARGLRVIRSNAMRLLKLITDLLEVVRLDARAAPNPPEPVNITRFVRATVESMRPLAEQKSLTLQTTGTTDAMTVSADPSRLEKVITNLLTNAIKFTPVGGSVTVAIGRRNGHATVDVMDTGIGIARSDLPRIFERFRQADGSATRRHQGAGIGLALARELVQEQGGRIRVASEPDRGALFTVEWPILNTPATVETPEDAIADPITGMYREAGRSVTEAHVPMSGDELQVVRGRGTFEVLVVEDEPELRELLSAMLEPHYRVRQASDGMRGLQSVRSHRPRLVLLDIMLPDMDGLEVCRQIKADPMLASTRVVLLTARTDEASKFDGLSAGADDFMQKPFSTAELQCRVANLLKAGELEVRLVQSEKAGAVGRLSAGILHEINNPLNASLMAIHVAQSRNQSPPVGECLADIESAMRRIQTITAGLRTFAHPDDATHGQSVSVKDVLSAVEQLLSYELAGLRLETNGVPDLRVRGSRNQLIHATMNIVSNSISAVRGVAERRSPRIMCAARADGDRVLLTLEDNGTGIAPADLPRVTEPFFTRRDVGQGMGLGLSISQTIAAAHGGRLVIESEQGSWTRVTLDLPRA